MQLQLMLTNIRLQMARFVDQAAHSSSRSTSVTSLKEYMKELSKKPKLVVLDIGKVENVGDINYNFDDSFQITPFGRFMWTHTSGRRSKQMGTYNLIVSEQMIFLSHVSRIFGVLPRDQFSRDLLP